MNLVRYEDWRVVPDPHPGSKNMPVPVGRVYVHHSAQPSPNEAGEVHLLRQIDRQHRQQGWEGIGYSFVIGPSGTVYEGRGQRVGAHTEGVNSSGFGVCFLGNFMQFAPTAAAVQAFVELCWHLIAVGALVPEFHLTGHRDWGATACPGNVLYAQLDEMRRMVAAGPKENAVPETPAPPDYGINPGPNGDLVAGIAGFPDGSYLILGADGGVFAFGPPGSVAKYHGRVHLG